MLQGLVKSLEATGPRPPGIAIAGRVRSAQAILRRGQKNLVLVARPKQGHVADFHAIADTIRRLVPDIHVTVVRDRAYNALRPQYFLRPTLTVAPIELRKLRPPRGTLVQNVLRNKSSEYVALEAAGFPVPKWALLTETTAADLSGFGEYAVTKPDCGGKGAEVKIKRRSRIQWKPPANVRAQKLGDSGLIVQEFIYTGQWPVSFRVTTLFGKVLFAWKVTAANSRRPLLGPSRFSGGSEGGGISIVSSGTGCQFALTDEADVLELACRAHAVFPDHPLLGFDIVREVPSGKLFIIEANTCGQLWHFSSPTGLSIQSDNQIDFKAQFNGMETAARVLIEETRRRAG